MRTLIILIFIPAFLCGQEKVTKEGFESVVKMETNNNGTLNRIEWKI